MGRLSAEALRCEELAVELRAIASDLAEYGRGGDQVWIRSVRCVEDLWLDVQRSDAQLGDLLHELHELIVHEDAEAALRSDEDWGEDGPEPTDEQRLCRELLLRARMS